MSKQKKYHYIYKTTCLITGKFYVGMHSTDNLDDGYLGSGKILGYSRHKYGDENHVREIVEFLSSREELKAREKEIVNEQLLADPLNINLKYGGDGGGILWNEEHAVKFHKAGWKAMQASVDATARAIKAGQTIRSRVKSGELQIDGGFIGKKHTEETRQKMSLAKKNRFTGELNSNYGKRNACIVRGGIRKRVSLQDLPAYLQDGWKRGLK